MPTQTYSIKRAAKKIGVSEKTIRRYIKASRLEAVLSAGPKGLEYIITSDSLERFLKNQEQNLKTKEAPPSESGAFEDIPKTNSENPFSLDYKKLFEDLLSRHEQAMLLMGKLRAEVENKVPLLEEKAKSLANTLEQKEQHINQITQELEIIKNRRIGIIRRIFRFFW